MLYKEELLEYIKHFTSMQIWDSGKVYDDVSYNDIYYLIEDSDKNNKIYEIHTKLSDVKYLYNDEVKSAFGIVIDIDTKDRDKGITVENLRETKKVASKIVQTLASYGIISLLKFSGGGYHILLFFDYSVLGDYLDVKDFQSSIIEKIIKNADVDKSYVKEIEIKHDQIRSLFSYNSKYGNYSVPSEPNQPVEIDLKASREYTKFNFVFENAVNMKISDSLALEITKAEAKKQANNKYMETSKLVDEALNALNLYGVENPTEDDIRKVINLVKPRVKASPQVIHNIALNLLKFHKSLTLYDEIYKRGVKDGRKRLLIFVIIPYLNIKFNGDKKKMEDEAYAWLKRSGIPESNLYQYRNIINALINNIVPGVKPTSIQSLLSRFDVSKDEFIKEYLR